MRWCIEKSKTSGTVLDPFLGSGTTLVACKELNRNGIGIELKPAYFKQAKRNLKAALDHSYQELGLYQTGEMPSEVKEPEYASMD